MAKIPHHHNHDMTKTKNYHQNKQFKLFISLTFIFGVFGCTAYPETPEEVVEKFTQYSANGECEAAMLLCEGHAKEIVQGNIDAGCGKYETTVDSVICDIIDDEANCTCYESRKEITGIGYPYELKKINDQWKIVENSKVVDMDEPSLEFSYLDELNEDLKLIEEIENDILERDSAIKSIINKSIPPSPF